MHACVGSHHRIDNRTGAVRRAVVHDEDLQAVVLAEHTLDEPLDVLALIVCRDDDQGLLSHAPSAR